MKYREPYNEIKGWLVANNITQKQLAKALNTSPNNINKRLNGSGSDLRLSEIKFMHNEFGIPMDYFLK